MPSVLATKSSTIASLAAMARVVTATLTVAVLYVGRDVLIPFALAALLSFLLSPVVGRLERFIGRVTATLLTVGILVGLVAGIGWVVTRQVVDLATRLPEYKLNIEAKFRSLQVPGSDRFAALGSTVEELKNSLPGTETAQPTSSGPIAIPAKEGQPPTLATPKDLSQFHPPPAPVEVVETTRISAIGVLSQIFSNVIGPFGTSALVLLLVCCMLLQREDLRGRLIGLLGSSNISITTRGMDDVAGRISRYLFMQLIVNTSCGLVIGVGSNLIGVPNAFVWGVLTAMLRFVPFVGVWIAAVFPIALSLAVSVNWTMPGLTVALFVMMELVCDNIIEPVLYGSSTGVSSIALILAAVFWTWIWGPAGLVLATPLTVCLVVIGRHVPGVSIFSLLLSDEQALAPHEEFYHRLLNPYASDTANFATSWLKSNSQTALYDTVLIPALATIQRDQINGRLEKEQ